MSSLPNNSFQYDKIDPNLRGTSDNLLSLIYNEDELQGELENARKKKLSDVTKEPSNSYAFFQNQVKQEAQNKFIDDMESRINSFIEEKYTPSIYSSDFSSVLEEENEKKIKQQSDWMAKELHPKSQDIRDWEAYQDVMLKGNLNSSLLTVALTGDFPSQIDPTKIGSSIGSYNESTFRRGSLIGRAQDHSAGLPQIGEMISSNAQTIHSLALRWRGGKNGEFWTQYTNKSDYLRRMFQEDPTTEKFLDMAVNMDPYLYDWNAITDSPWRGKNIFDYLAEAPKPDDWDPKLAIEKIKTETPDLAFVLFEQMGLKDSDLLQKDISKNPQTFKFFIADAIDTHAMAIISEKFNEQSNWVARKTFDLVYPTFRDSFNSNDTVSEIGLTVGGMLLAVGGAAATPVTGGVGAPVAAGGATTAATAGTSLFLKVARATRASARIAQIIKMEKTASNLAKLGRGIAALEKVNNRGLKVITALTRTASKISHFAPHNLAESLLELSKGTKFGALLYAAEEKTLKQLYGAGFKEVGKTLGRYTLRSALNGAGQGAIEDMQRQWLASKAGFQTQFEFSTMGQNMIEEGVGEVLMGGTLNVVTNINNMARVTTQRKLEWMDKLKLGLDTKFKGMGDGVKKNAIELWNKLPSHVRQRLEIAIATQFGIDSEILEKMTLSQQVDFKVTAIQLNHKLEELGIKTGFGNMLDGESKSEFVENVLLAVTNGNREAITPDLRMGLTQVLFAVDEATKDRASGSSTLTPGDFAIIAYKWARESITNSGVSKNEQEASLKRLQDSVFKDQFKKLFPDGVSITVNGEEKKITDFSELIEGTEEEQKNTIETISKHLGTEETRVSGLIWGADKENTLESLSQGFVLSAEETKLLDEAAAEYARVNGLKQVKVKGGGVGSGRVVASSEESSGTKVSEELDSETAQAMNTNQKTEATPTPVSTSVSSQPSPSSSQTTANAIAKGFNAISGAVSIAAAADLANRLNKVLNGTMTFDEFLKDAGLKPGGQSEQNARIVYDQVVGFGFTSIDGPLFLALLNKDYTSEAFVNALAASAAASPIAPKTVPVTSGTTTAPEAAPTTPETAPKTPEAAMATEAAPKAPEAAVAPEAAPTTPEATPAVPKLEGEEARTDLTVARALDAGLKADTSPDAELDSGLLDFVNDVCHLKKD